MEALIKEKLPLTDTNDPYILWIRELSQLEDNWDGKGGRKPTRQAIENMNGLVDFLSTKFPDELHLSVPQDIYPFSHGTIAIDWYDNNRLSLHIEVGKTTLACYIPNYKDGAEEDGFFYFKQNPPNALICSIPVTEWQKIFTFLNQP